MIKSLKKNMSMLLFLLLASAYIYSMNEKGVESKKMLVNPFKIIKAPYMYVDKTRKNRLYKSLSTMKLGGKYIFIADGKIYRVGDLFNGEKIVNIKHNSIITQVDTADGSLKNNIINLNYKSSQ